MFLCFYVCVFIFVCVCVCIGVLEGRIIMSVLGGKRLYVCMCVYIYKLLPTGNCACITFFILFFFQGAYQMSFANSAGWVSNPRCAKRCLDLT